MPMLMKNSPMSRPRNGRMSASIWWRNSVSDSSRPARNAPRVSCRPTPWVAAAVPNTTRSVMPKNTSGPLVVATMRNTGCST